MEVYKINHICINQLNTQFSLSYNNGIKIYNLKNFDQISCSNLNNKELVRNDYIHFINFSFLGGSPNYCNVL